MLQAATVDARLYRAGLFLLPPAFRREFSNEMIRDFASERLEAARAGRMLDLWRFRARMAADLLGAVVTQWIRTGLPAIACLAASATTLALSGIARVWPPLMFSLPAGTEHADTIELVLLVSVVLLVIVATVIFTIWFTQRSMRPIPRRRLRY
jgi:hypothetical protein